MSVPVISRENQHGLGAMSYHPTVGLWIVDTSIPETVSRQNFTILRRIRDKAPGIDPRKHKLIADLLRTIRGEDCSTSSPIQNSNERNRVEKARRSKNSEYFISPYLVKLTGEGIS